MTKNEFYAIWLDAMDFYSEFTIADITEETPLTNFSNWDSLSRATVLNLVEENLSVTLDIPSLRQCQTIGDVMKLTGKFNE